MAAAQKTKVVSAFLAINAALEVERDSERQEEEALLNTVTILVNQVSEREEGIRIPGYFESVVCKYSDKIFRSHFRLRKSSVEKSCQKTGGRPVVALEEQVCIFLWYAASKEPLRSISDRSTKR